MLNSKQLFPFRVLRYCLLVPLLLITMLSTGQIRKVNIYSNSEIMRAYAGAIPNKDVQNKTIYVDDQEVSFANFKDRFQLEDEYWGIPCGIIYMEETDNIYIYTDQDQCNELMPAPPTPPAPPAAPTPVSPVRAELPPPPPHPAAVEAAARPPAPPLPPTPPSPFFWNSISDWADLDERRSYLRAMEKKGADFYLNDKLVDRRELEKIDSDQIKSTDVSANSNDGVQTITIKVYTKE